MNNWRRVDDIIEYFGKGVTPKYVDESSIIVLNQKCIRNNKIDFSLAQYIDDRKDYIEIKFLKVGDILVNSTGQGTAGRVAFLDFIPVGKRIIVDSHILVLRTKDFYESRCLNYSLFSIEHILQTYLDGSTGQGEFDRVRLFNIQVNYSEDKTTQQKIAKFLSDLDAKIELNNRINAELEAMAKLVYEYWFVQFDFPISTEQAEKMGDPTLVGKPYKSSRGKMVWNKELKREIPEGWRNGTISDIASLTRGVTYNKDDIKDESTGGTVPILRATNITGNQIDLNSMVYVSKSLVDEEQILKPFDILITMSSGSIDHIGKNGFYLFNERVAFGAFCAKIEALEDFEFYLYSYTQSVFFFTTIKNECLGTNINNLNGSMVKGFKMVIPDNSTLIKFNGNVKPFFEKIRINSMQNQQLSTLRDWLLPMLMNGQVTVTDADERVEEELGMVAEPERDMYYKTKK